MSEENKVTIEVDGKSIEAKAGALLIDVADEAGINIPRFCYHNKLSVAASCRMCLVEVEKVPKAIPACATQINDGMKVFTKSPMAIAAQKGTMEFLLINHPLDCPICDQGGECELQDVAMGYGSDVTTFVEGKRCIPEKDIGPLIATDMSRCIHCTRCVRFGDEIAGMRELGATGRGEYMAIGTYVARSVDSELSGNVIDLCPVGALTSKPFRYQARAWELSRHDAVAPHDGVGSNIQIHVRRNQVMRVHPRANEALNEVWISDRDRFSYEGIYSDDRLTKPLIKKDGNWVEADWDEALQAATEGLKDAGADLATLASANSTLEELYLTQKVARGLGSANVDHRLRQVDFRGDADEASIPTLGQKVADLESLNAALLVGSNVRKDQPLLALRLRKAALKGAAISFVNPLGLDLHFDARQLVSTPAEMVKNLAAIAKAAGASAEGAVQTLIDQASAGEEHQAVANQLKEAAAASVLLGNMAESHPDYSILCALASAIAKATDAVLGVLPAASNTVGAALAGAVPQGSGGKGLNAGAMLESTQKGYLLLGVEPAFDCGNPAQAVKNLEQSSCVVALTPYRSASLEQCADIMLPISTYAETSGTYVNAEGGWQSFRGAVTPAGDARPGWKVLRVLGNLLNLNGFEYNSSEEIKDELQQAVSNVQPGIRLNGVAAELATPVGELVRVGDVPMYSGDALVRRSGALQRTKDARDSIAVRINASVAKKNSLANGDSVAVIQGENRATLPIKIDVRVPDGCAQVSAGMPGSETLGSQFGEVTLEKV